MQTISQSKVKAWMYCPALFFRQYILGLDRYTPAFDRGGDFHKMVEMYHKRQEHDFERNHRTGEVILDPASKPVREYIFNPETIKDYSALYPVDWYDAPQDAKVPFNKGTMTKRNEAGTWPLVEHRLEVELLHPYNSKPLGLPLTAIFDGIRLASPPGLYDLKTSTVAWSQRRADEDLQATLYIYVWWQLTGDILPFTFIIKRNNPGPRTKPLQDPLTTNRTTSDFATLFNEFEDVINQITTATRYPCNCQGKPHRIKGITE